MKKIVLLLLFFISIDMFGQTYLINEGFSAGATAPTGWTFTGIGGTYTSAGNYGASSPSLKFDATGDAIETPSFTNGDQLSFWIKGQSISGTSYALLIEEYYSSAWHTIENVTSIANTATTKTYTLNSNSTKVKATFTKGTGNLSLDDVKITQASISEPTIQSSNVGFSAVTTNSFTVNWTSGNGTNRVVFMKDGSGTITDPSDGSAYTASSDWNSKGTQLGVSGYYCVYNGADATVSITNLAPSTTYYVYVYEYNGTGATCNYLLTTPANNSQLTNTPSTPTLTISNAGLTEENLNGAVITLTLTNETFKDVTLDLGNFSLINQPAVTAITSVNYVSETEATITVSFDGTDFDLDINDFNITVAAAELTSNILLNSNNLMVTATIETAPAVTTNDAITTNGITTATWGGEVIATGGEAVLQKGLVWNTTAVPTIDNFKTSEGAGIGSITGEMTGLTANTTYYVRAYSTNSVGTNYGTEYNFTTNGLSAPVANDASGFSTTGFTANWEAVTGAESYRLDVATTSEFGTTIINEDFSGFTSDAGTADRSLTLDSYLHSAGWTGSKVYEMIGYAKLGTSSAIGTITTPLLDLSINGGNHTLTFDIKQYSSDAGLVQVLLSTDNSTYNQIGSDITPTSNFTTYTINIIGGTATSKIKIQSTVKRFYLDNVNIAYSSNLTSYDNLTVNATSQEVTGLSAGTDYYYRVRAFCSTSTSGNSSTINAPTSNLNTNPPIGSGNGQSLSIGHNTGIGNIVFNNVTHGGNVSVNRFHNAPSNPAGIVGNVSQYRWIIEPNNSMVFVAADGYTLRFEIADCPGITELEEGDDTRVKLYKRSNPGHGNFTDMGFLTYHRNETDGNQTDDYLISALITNGFSEFSFGSSDPLPVELSSFTASFNKTGVILNWQTATEINNHSFEIERKINNGSFEKIGTINGNGNSNVVRDYTFTDSKLLTSGNYQYRLKQIDNDGSFTYTSVVDVVVGVPAEFSLTQNYPNPFNPSTTINFNMPTSDNVKIVIFNALGQQITTLVNGYQEAGFHSVNFNASQLTSGIYFYQMEAGNFKAVKKMIFAK
ncbi:MAG: T9SS type A sorting domain-containing protein [bacterium]